MFFYAGLNDDIETNVCFCRFERLEARGLRPAWAEQKLLSGGGKLGMCVPSVSEYTFINVMDEDNVVLR
jgi:hypothetical protein